MTFELKAQGYPEASAEISEDGRFRYTLTRVWDASAARALICMLNPSTADAAKDDPTIRRCIGLCSDLGFGGFTVVNLLAFRATDPGDMLGLGAEAFGPKNTETWAREIARATTIIAAWGAQKHPLVARQAKAFCETVAPKTVHCFGLTKDLQPRHPDISKDRSPSSRQT